VTNAATASFGSRKERKRRRVYVSRTTFGLQKFVSAANVDFIQAGSVADSVGELDVIFYCARARKM